MTLSTKPLDEGSAWVEDHNRAFTGNFNRVGQAVGPPPWSALIQATHQYPLNASTFAAPQLKYIAGSGL
jgi:hypothetical protein